MFFFPLLLPDTCEDHAHCNPGNLFVCLFVCFFVTELFLHCASSPLRLSSFETRLVHTKQDLRSLSQLDAVQKRERERETNRGRKSSSEEEEEADTQQVADSAFFRKSC